MIGLQRTNRYLVRQADLASTIYTNVRKHPVLATVRVLEWCEAEIMLRLDRWCERVGRANEWSLGHRVHFYHVRPAKAGRLVVVRVGCVRAGNRSSEWAVAAYGAGRFGAASTTLALGTLGFVLADNTEYTEQHLAPRQLATATGG